MMSALRFICFTTLILSLAVGVGLILWDIAHGFEPLLVHQRGMAIALMLVGASYAFAHASGKMKPGTRVRAIALGGAFVLWGLEQFIPMGHAVIAVDCVLVIVFVVDLGLGVRKRLLCAELGDE